MIPEERAKAIVGPKAMADSFTKSWKMEWQPSLQTKIENAISEAVAEEREACAKTVEEYATMSRWFSIAALAIRNRE